MRVGVAFETSAARGAFTRAATTVFFVVFVVRTAVSKPGGLFGQRQERFTLDTAEASPRGFFEKEDDKCENQAQADGQSEWDD